MEGSSLRVRASLEEPFLFSRDNIPQHEMFQSSVYLIIRQKIEKFYVTFKEFTLYSNSPVQYPMFLQLSALFLTFVCPCIFCIIVNDDQQDATILAYLFIRNQQYMFRVKASPIIRSI